MKGRSFLLQQVLKKRQAPELVADAQRSCQGNMLCQFRQELVEFGEP